MNEIKNGPSGSKIRINDYVTLSYAGADINEFYFTVNGKSIHTRSVSIGNTNPSDVYDMYITQGTRSSYDGTLYDSSGHAFAVRYKFYVTDANNNGSNAFVIVVYSESVNDYVSIF